MHPHPTSREYQWYILAFAIALAFRFTLLGSTSLTDIEAHWALQALHIAQGAQPVPGMNVGYTSLTAILFYIFESNNFLARFFPALIGSLLVFSPLAFRKYLHKITALLLAFALAIDPGLVALSRQAGSAMPGIGFTIFAMIYCMKFQWKTAGMMAGLALLSGSPIWMAALGLGITSRLIKNRETVTGLNPAPAPDWKSLLSVAAATIVLVSSLFLLSPGGLSAWLNTPLSFVTGWWQPAGISAEHLLKTLLFNHPLPVIFGLVAIARALLTGNHTHRWLGVWAGIALALALLYPARQPADLIWALLPLWVLAISEIQRHFGLHPQDERETNELQPRLEPHRQDERETNELQPRLEPHRQDEWETDELQPRLEPHRQDHWETGGTFILILSLLIFASLTLLSLRFVETGSQEWVIRFSLLIGSLLLASISLIMIALGWAIDTAQRGGVWSATALLLVYTLSAAWSNSGLRIPGGYELWQTAPPVLQEQLLLETIDLLTETSPLHNQLIPIQITGVQSPSLEWALRKHPLTVTERLDLVSRPEIVITSVKQTDLELPAAYRGQDFVWRKVFLEDINTRNWLSWLAEREIHYQHESIILWARTDLFLDFQNP